MNILNLNTLNFSGKYINSKYSNPYTTNSILNNKTTSNSVPDDLDRNNIQSLYDYSKDRIKDLHEYFVLDSEIASDWINKNINRAFEQIKKGGINSSRTEMVLDLVKDKKLIPDTLYKLTGDINKNAAADLDKLFEAYADSKDVKKVFVPKFKNIDEAANGIEIGDVCQIEGNKNISTKLPDGTIKELFISVDTYLELFPPVERFITCQSDNTGDCYLLGTLDGINHNSNTRYILLEMFRENDDGTVDAALGGFKFENGQIIQKNPKKTIIKNISAEIQKQAPHTLSYTCEGIRAFEILHQKFREEIICAQAAQQYERYGKLLEMIDEGKHIDEKNSKMDFYIQCLGGDKLLNDMKNTDSILTSNFYFTIEEYTKEELEYFQKFLTDGEEMFNMLTVFGRETLTEDEIVNKLSELNNKTDNMSRYETLILTRWLNGIVHAKTKAVQPYEIIPKRAYLDIFNKDAKYGHYNNGGSIPQALKFFGIDVIKQNETEYCFIDSDSAKKHLFNPDCHEHIFCCLCKPDKENLEADFPIYANHAYTVQPIDINGARKFLVRNPHNSLNEIIYTYDELCEKFEALYCGTLHDSDK